MSLRVLELQTALPRTLDAGKIQEQLQRQNQILNDQAVVEVHKEEKRKQTTVISQEGLREAAFHEKESSKDAYLHTSKKRKKAPQEEVNADHPYKGKSIDYSG